MLTYLVTSIAPVTRIMLGKRTQCLLAIMILAFLTEINMAADQEEAAEGAEGQQAMKVARMVGMNMTGSDENGMPEKIRLEFSVDDDMVTLNLTINRHTPSKAPVYVGRENGVIEKMDIGVLDKFAVYTDDGNSASFLYRTHRDEDGSSKKKFSGSFRMGNEDYMLEPATTSAHHERVRRDLGDHMDPDDTYIVYSDAAEAAQIYDGDYLVGRKDKKIQYRRSEQNPPSQFADELVQYYQAPHTSGKQMYFVESFWVLDYGTYQRWYNLAHSQNPHARDVETINNIRYYYTHVANGVDMRYRSINEPDYGITVKLIGFYIASTPSAARWSEIHRETDGQRQYVEAYRMLDDLIKWTEDRQKAGKLPNFDQVTMFTGYQLFNDYRRDGTRRSINGLADIEGICTKFKVSVNYDRGLYAATQTSAHEMAHSLGAIHDGPNNNCESSDQYIMAISPGSLTSSNFNNVFRFSPCSRHEIRLHLTYLRMQGKNCLMNPAENTDQAEIDRHLERLPGQIFSPDDQCRYIHGPNAYYCGGQISDKMICHGLVCYNPLTRKCTTTVEERAANGTSCGNKKWCMFGKCQYSDQAPDQKDYCISGDSRALLSDATRCEDISLTTHKCYLDHFREPCCQSCLDAKNESNPYCIYGDKVHWCHTIIRSDCYNSGTRNDCCQTCAQARTDKFENCQYGDRASWCRTMKDSGCYSNGRTCCETCGKLREENEITGRYPSNCAFGDRASWCTDHRSRPWQCYISANTCCATCHDISTGIPGCEFGDKMSGCYNADCTDSYYQRRCCATCSAYNGLTRPPPTTRRTTTTTTTTHTPTTSISTTPTPTTTITTSVTVTPTQKCIMEGRNLASWCNDPNLFKGICYKSAAICCVTCASVDRGTEECRYGDMISWCPLIYAGACYNAKTERQCCSTCERHRDYSDPDCRYGDRYRWCRTERDRCDEASIRDNCCYTCADFKPTTSTTTTTTRSTSTTTTTTQKPGVSEDTTTSSTMSSTTTTRPTTTPPTTKSSTAPTVTLAPIECPRGDQASWCPTIPASYCYTSEYTCCATCQAKLIPTNEFDCRYGNKFTWCPKINIQRCSESGIQDDCCELCKDYQPEVLNPVPVCQVDSAEWCSSIHQRECYEPSTKDTCCQTCLRLGTGEQGCEYGDKTPVCEGLDCTDPEIRDICCETCTKQSKVTSVRPTTPETPADEGCQGDTVTWCRTIKSLHCYSDNDVCCRTCLKFYLGFRGCEYGDRVSWCKNVIEKPADCERPDIGDKCCYTCALLGNPSTRENPEEWREGVLVAFMKEDMSRIIAEEMDMLMFLSHQVNEFCLDNPQECCLHLYPDPATKNTDLMVPEINVDDVASQPRQRPNMRIVLPSDCHIAGGYPRHSENNDGEIITKYLVKLRPDALEPLCGGPQKEERSNRRRRDAGPETQEKTIYFSKHKLRDLIVENKDIIESAMGVQIARVALSGEIKRSSFNIVIGIAAGALVAFLLVSIVLIITIQKLMRTFRAPSAPKQQSDSSVVNMKS